MPIIMPMIVSNLSFNAIPTVCNAWGNNVIDNSLSINIDELIAAIELSVMQISTNDQRQFIIFKHILDKSAKYGHYALIAFSYSLEPLTFTSPS